MSESLRGIFFEAEHAETVARVLARDGYAVEVVVERLAGEDDDEDHQWAVVTDAPALALEILVDEFDGWLDEGEDLSAPAVELPPLILPRAPLRPGAADSSGRSPQ